MKYLLILLLSLSPFLAEAKKSWAKHYKLVNSDIKSVEALGSRDLGLKIRLFELYGEKLGLLIERERDYRIKYLKTKNNKRLKSLMKKQKKTLKKLDKLGNRIEKSTKDKKILTKINFFKALNYLSLRNEKKFYFYMKRAEKTNKDKKTAYEIFTKLADFYFTNEKWKESSFYHKKIIKNKKDKWLSKNYFNLAWSELKLNKFASALNYLKKSHLYDRQKGYYKIGDQLIDSLLLFHAYAQQTEAGLIYFRRYKINDFENLLKYLHYVFGHGKRTDGLLVIKEIQKKKLTAKQEYQLLEKRILVYKTLKKYGGLQSELAKFKSRRKKLKNKRVPKEIKEDLISSIKSYSGFLQELIRSRRLLTEKKKRAYVQYIAYNFNVLKEIDRKNALEYSFFEGETYFSQGMYKKATIIYSDGLKAFKKTGKKKNSHLKKTFDSLFKSLENQKRPQKSSLLFAYNTYIYFYPKSKKSNIIFQRMLALHRSSGDEKAMFATLKRYNKFFPKQVKVQKDFYKQVLNTYIDKKDIPALRSLQKLVDNRFLGFTVKESNAIEKIIKQIRFSKYEDLAKNGKIKEAIDGFYRLFNDKKGKYSLRIDALRKAMLYQNKDYLFIDLSKAIVTATGFMRKKDKKTHHDELMFYGQNICYGDYQKSCLDVLNAFKKDRSFRLTDNLENFHFKLTTLFSSDLNKDYLKAKTPSNKNFVFKLLLLEEKDFSNKLFAKLYTDPKMKGVIAGEIERMVINTFYDYLDVNRTKRFINTISIPSLKNKYLSEMDKLSATVAKINFKLPPTPKQKIITEQIFVNFGQAVEQGAGKIIGDIGQIISTSNPNYLPFIMSKIVSRFEAEVLEFKKFIPVSKNADFEAAMNDAVVNFHRIFDGKIIEYRSIYFRTLQNTIKGSGAKKYGSDIMTKPKLNSYDQVKLWQN